ncbi:MAG: methyltransferase domain-containing protein [Candidatus Marinimicrobia bacterium]|nr:methyltransferase domain-containing protein [Candidatus Neomarinimicrobiota bacterium]
MSTPVKSNCPLCQSIANVYASYPGKFLSCNELLQCQNCDLIFADKIPSKNELNKYYSTGLYYDKVSNPYNPDFMNFSLKLSISRLNLIFSKLNNNNTNKIIDIGAGNAQLGIALKEYNNDVYYDVVEPDIKVRKQYGDWVKQHFTDICEIKIVDYNLAVLNQVLEHVSEPVNFLDSIYKLLQSFGYVYIDVPYQDYLFKPSVEPHILFWNKKSLSTLLEKVGFKMLFCDTAGMPHHIAKRFFNKKSFLQKLTNSWLYKAKINSLISNIGFLKPFDTFKQFQSENYGGDRQWLRCIAQKIN